jgi:hypothetical protein
MSDGDVVIRGVAHRGECDPEIAVFVANARLSATVLPVYPQLNQHTTIGEAEVNIAANGDVNVRATIFARHTSWLMGFPFLGVTINDPEDGPREIIQVAVTDNVTDPLQLPYRIVEFDDTFRREFSYFYDPVVEIDEPYEARVQLSNDGSIHPVFDTNKVHQELRHRTERLRRDIPDAIARAFGYDSWTRDLETCDGCDEHPMTLTVLREVMGVLNNRQAPRRAEYPVIGLPVIEEGGTTGVSP